MTQPLRVFDKYDLIRRIGSGGMGDIFLARQAGVGGFDRLVVLKSLRAEIAKDEGFLAQFLNEARVAATINHPNVVVVYEVDEYRGVYFLAMEYINGADLTSVLRAAFVAKQRLPFRYSAGVVRDAALGLDHAHDAKDKMGRPLGIVHRDVSPQNIMVRLDGVVKVVDFGIAAAANSFEPSNRLQGKLRYMSPEQVRTEALDGRSDQFALGVVLWELCTQRRLFHRENPAAVLHAVVHSPIPRPSQLVKDIPKSLDAIVMKMLERERDERFHSCRDAAFALEAFLTETGGPAVQLQSKLTSLLLGSVVTDRVKNLAPEAITITGLLGTTEHQCSSCGHRNSVRNRFCAACGAKMGSSATRKEVTGSDSSLEHAELWEALEKKQAQPALGAEDLLERAKALSERLRGEKRIVTLISARVLKRDIVQQSIPSEQRSDVERALLERYRTEGDELDAEFETLTPWEVRMFVGARRSDPADCENALQCARRIVAGVRNLGRTYGVSIELAAGLDSAEAEVSPESSGRLVIRDELLQVADQLSHEAALSSHSGVFVSERLGDRLSTFAGFTQVVLRPAGDSEEVRGLELDDVLDEEGLEEHVFVGRKVEQVEAGERMLRACRGDSGALIFSGESGVGKTRFLRELMLRARAKGLAPIWLGGAGLDGSELLRRLLRSTLEALILEGVPKRADKGLEWLEKVGGLDENLAARVRDELNRPTPTDREERLAADAVLIKTLRSISTVRPLSIFVDGIEHLSLDGGQLLSNLVARAHGMRIVIIGACSSNTQHAFSESTSPLSPLSDAELLSIAESALGEGRLPPEAGQLVLERAGGSPALASLLVHRLIEGGGLEEAGPGRWQITERLGAIALPNRVEALLSSRIDRLSGDVQMFLRVGSVAGAVFSPSLVAQVTGQSDEVKTLVRTCVRARLLELRRESGVVCFAQPAVRTVLLSRVRDDDLKQIHFKLAQLISKSASRDDADAMVRVTDHLLNAGAGIKAANYAIHSAGLLGSGVAATRLYRAAGEIYRDLAKNEADESSAKTINRFIASAVPCLATSDLREAESFYAALEGFRAEVADPVGAARALRERGLVRVQLGQIQRAADDFTRAETLNGGQDPTLFAALLSDRAAILEAKGLLEEAVQLRVRALEAAHDAKLEDPNFAWSQSNALGRVYFKMGELALAEPLFEAAFEQAGAAGHPAGQAKALGNLAAARASAGQGPAALAALARASALAERAADPIGQARIAYNRGTILLSLKDMIGARDALEEAAEKAREVGWAEGLALAVQAMEANALSRRV